METAYLRLCNGCRAYHEYSHFFRFPYLDISLFGKLSIEGVPFYYNYFKRRNFREFSAKSRKFDLAKNFQKSHSRKFVPPKYARRGHSRKFLPLKYKDLLFQIWYLCYTLVYIFVAMFERNTFLKE